MFKFSHQVASIVFTYLLSIPYPKNIISGIWLIISLVFGKIWIGTIYLCAYVHAGAVFGAMVMIKDIAKVSIGNSFNRC